MKNKLKYCMSGILLLLIIILIIEIPKLYFLSLDTNMKKNYTIHSLNLNNLYDDNNLTNDKKIELLMNPKTKKFSFQDKINEEEYIEIMTKIKIELKKIDEDSYNLFTNLFDFNFKNIDEINVIKRYISNENYESFTLKQIEYYTENTEISILIDTNNFTIFKLTAIEYEHDEDEDEITLTEAYQKYLQLSKKSYNVYAHQTNHSIILRSWEENYNSKENEFLYDN